MGNKIYGDQAGKILLYRIFIIDGVESFPLRVTHSIEPPRHASLFKHHHDTFSLSINNRLIIDAGNHCGLRLIMDANIMWHPPSIRIPHI